MFLLDPIEAFKLAMRLTRNVIDSFNELKKNRLNNQNFYRWQAKEVK